MLSLTRHVTFKSPARERIRADVEAYLYDAFTGEESLLAGLDRWTQKRVSSENLAKLELALEADDPVEYCYQNLIREIDTEAEPGVFLVRAGAQHPVLKPLVGEAGISGRLYQELEHVAPRLFADELAHSNDNLDLVWVTIQAQHDRAVVDAQISAIIMKHLLGSTGRAADMALALRSLLYAFHEDCIRRQCGLARVLNDRAMSDLVTMITELSARSGDYDHRTREITDRAERL